MPKRKRWTPKEKLNIVLEGLKNNNVAETCRKHGIYESQYYQWKKKLFDSADDIFQNGSKKDPEKEKLKKEKEKLEKTIVDLTCELQILKKNDI
jgi:transposase-like protein